MLQDTLALRLLGPPHLPPQPPYPVITDGTVGIGKASRDKSMAIDSFDLLPPLGSTALVNVPCGVGGEMTHIHTDTPTSVRAAEGGVCDVCSSHCLLLHRTAPALEGDPQTLHYRKTWGRGHVGGVQGGGVHVGRVYSARTPY